MLQKLIQKVTLPNENQAEEFFFSNWVFFHKHSRITGLQGMGEGI